MIVMIVLYTLGALFIQTFEENRDMIANIKRHFPQMYLHDLHQDLNKPLICLKSDTKQNFLSSSEELREQMLTIQKHAISKHGGKLNNNNFDLVSLVKTLKKV